MTRFLARQYSGLELLSRLTISGDRYSGLYKLLCDPVFLMAAYNNIKVNFITKSTFGSLRTDNYNQDYFFELSLSFVKETFQFSPKFLMYMLTMNGVVKPFGIPSFRDKIIQEAMRMVLFSIYEPIFSVYSYGYRMTQSYRSVFHIISKWQKNPFWIEGRVDAFLFNVDYLKLILLLTKKVKDQQFIDLVWKLCKSGLLVDLTTKSLDSQIKFMQSLKVSHKILKCWLKLKTQVLFLTTSDVILRRFTLSTLFSNIYLHEFDVFIQNYMKYFTSLGDCLSNSSFLSFSEEKKNVNDLLYGSKKKRKIILKVVMRISYVRYFDKWLLSVRGSYSFVLQVKNVIIKFFKVVLNLFFEPRNIIITNVFKYKVLFLGVYCWVFKGKRRFISPFSKVKFSFPVFKLLQKLACAGFLRDFSMNRNLVTNAISKWISLDHCLILERYNSIISMILQYYSFVDNFKELCKLLNFILRHSCAKTLARKYKKRSRAWAFKEFGRNLSFFNKKSGLFFNLYR